MYYPYLRGKKNELLALKDLANEIATCGKVIPIIEPVSLSTVNKNCFKAYVDSNMPFVLIVNPQCTQKVTQLGVQRELITPLLSTYENFIPAFFVSSRTSQTNIESFCAKFANHDKALIYGHEPSDRSFTQFIAQKSDIKTHVFFAANARKQLHELISPSFRVTIRDAFQKEIKNSLYPPEDFFSEDHKLYPSTQYSGYGDYSIVGNNYTESGGPAYAVVIHHIYFTNKNKDTFNIKHYLSDQTETRENIAGKFIEALSKLVADLPKLGAINQTMTTKEYVDLLQRAHFPSLGGAKRLGIRHHLELMLRYYA